MTHYSQIHTQSVKYSEHSPKHQQKLIVINKKLWFLIS